MQRKGTNQKVERLRRYDGTEWQRKCLRWTEDNLRQIEAGTAAMPDELGDREQDIYEPLFVLANLAGGHWPEKIRQAALALCGKSSDDASQEGSIQLLTWIKTYFDETPNSRVIPSALAEWLNSKAEAPFAAWSNGKGIKPSEVRRLLAGFDIQTKPLRFGKSTARGYEKPWFEDAFACYLPGNPDEKCNSVTTLENIGDSGGSGSVTEHECYNSENTIPANKDGPCYNVTVPKQETAPESPSVLEI
jgi:putative DNA primase/helicase